MPALPEPRPGLVIGYSYLWESEYRAGLEEGAKDRPCAVVIATRSEAGDLMVTVAPVTHRAPADPAAPIEIPAATTRALGRDDARSWLVCSEFNRFAWPGPDLRPIARHRPGEFVYGMLPRTLMLRVYERLQALRAERRPVVVVRSP